ncbi:putative beta-glucosidase D [Aspergillus sclerotiicarbonarius CBS 121057]|uniref:beta-glucosidase n=1 Tax=Aspergillus sclerotiicarbonarius (strain CBS 121057 / IBT 28362) TaxID=1448318 RepID=A0A319E4C6_ASPSB|nr:putative beta-glucosidase D [Aspergillus sclerotiicarbonarius CBS 121057]
MRALSFIVAAALLGLTGASSNSSSLGLLKSDGVALGDWESAYQKASSFVAGLTTDQKLALITGSSIESTNGSFTALNFLDGDMGLQDYFYVSAFSLSSAIAMTWDRDAIYDQAKAVGSEFYNKGVQVVAGPTSQPLGRTPWGGRNVEGFGPDPYLNGLATGLTTKGYVDAGVIPGGKHFLLYEQETNRTGGMGGGMGGGGGPGGFPGGGGMSSGGRGPGSSNSSSTGSRPTGSISRRAASSGSSSDSAPYSSNADDKTLHESYLWPFYDAVKNGLGAVMCAMTKVNGTLSCHNSDLLMKHLKTELGFPGLVWPDMNGQSSALESAVNGEDYGSSSIWSTSTMETLLSNGSLSEARLDDMAIRNLMGYYYVNLDNGLQPDHQNEDAYVDVRGNHSKLIRKNGAKSMALLKNKNVLPLNKPRVMSVFGAHAGPVMGGPNMQMNVEGSGPTYQGHLASGTGSGQASYPYLVAPYVSLTNKASEDGTMLRWILNDTYSSSSGSSLITQGTDSTAVAPSYTNYATNADACLVFLNALSGEGADRTELYNDDQDTMVNTVADNCNNTIVVINAVGPRLMDQWVEHDNVTAVLYGSLLGQESGNSIIDVLYGDVNPSGRLTYTIAKNESDYNVDLCYTAQCNFTEGVYLDYRYFDAYKVTPRYPFGHGLSYTTFSYSDLTINKPSNLTEYPTGEHTVGGHSDLWDNVASVSVEVANTGSLDGAEVPQLYLGFPSSAQQPVRQLRGFERVEIAAGDKSKVTFKLRRRDISYWDVTAQQWLVASGNYKVYVGASSRDLKLNGTFTVQASS